VAPARQYNSVSDLPPLGVIKHMNRFVVTYHQGRWLVINANCSATFSTREGAENAAFVAADSLAIKGQAVSVVIMPEEIASASQDHTGISGCALRLDDAQRAFDSYLVQPLN
jgi:hypothetical protein